MKKIIIFTVCTGVILIAVWYFKFKNNPQTIPEEVIPYPTGVFAEDISWIDNKCFIYSSENEVNKYCTSGSMEKIMTILSKYDESIFREIILSENFICDTYNFEIANPSEIATRIILYSLDTKDEFKKLENNLTLKVDRCNETLRLSTTFPFLEYQEYLWNIDDISPLITDVYVDTTKISIDNSDTTITFDNGNKITFRTVSEFSRFIPNSDNTKILLIDPEKEVWIFENSN